MSLFGIARGLGVLGLQVWDAASFILRPERPFFEPRDGAERLAEMEAQEEVSAPWDCGVGMPQRGDRVAVELADGTLQVGLWDPDLPGLLDTDPERLREAELRDTPTPVGTFEDPKSFLRLSEEPTPPDTTSYPETNGANGPENEEGCEGYCIGCESAPCPPEWDFAANQIPMQTLVAPLTADEITAVRRLLESSATPASRTAVEQADGPEVEVSPAPSTSGHLTFGTDPSAMYERMLRQRLNEDRDPTK